jgi:hypothetical protein
MDLMSISLPRLGLCSRLGVRPRHSLADFTSLSRVIEHVSESCCLTEPFVYGMVDLGPYVRWMVWLGYIPVFAESGGGRRWRPSSGQAARVVLLVLANLAVYSAYLYNLLLYAKFSSMLDILVCIFKVIFLLHLVNKCFF